MLRESLKDAGDILLNILNQPLSIKGAKQPVSLLQAAQSFRPEEAMTSDLRKIVMSFMRFPESTENMIKELNLIVDELKHAK